MNITDFEEYFSPRILERGKEYYRNHHVITLDRIEEGYYEAEVEGSQIYTVFVELEENGEISDISCDCPYDWEEFCICIAGTGRIYSVRGRAGTETDAARTIGCL